MTSPSLALQLGSSLRSHAEAAPMEHKHRRREPKRHLQSTVYLNGGGQCSTSLLHVATLDRERAQAAYGADPLLSASEAIALQEASLFNADTSPSTRMYIYDKPQE